MFKSNLSKITAIILSALCLIGVFTACEEKDPSVGSTTAYDYDLKPFVTLGKYMGVEIGPYDPVSVTEEEIQNEINYIIQYHTTTESVSEGTLALGDTANIDYVGSIDGVEFEGGADQAFDLMLGSGAFIPGFEDGIVGHNVGETFTINVTFPEDFGNTEFAGKEAEFAITINSITIPIVPEYNDEFVAANVDGYSTTAEHKESLRSELLKEKETNLESTKMNDAWRVVVENAEIKKLPQTEVDRYIEEIKTYYTEEATYYGYTLDQYVEAVGMTMEDFDQYTVESAEATVREELVLYSIVRAEKIEITDEEYEPLLQEYVNNLGYANVAELEEVYGKEILIHNLLWDKVYELLFANAVEAV